MRVPSALLAIIVLTACLGRSDAIGQMLGPNFNSAVQLVVLKNGETFRGRVSRKAEQVIVETVQGSRIVLTDAQTDFICNSFEEAYWGKSARTRATDLDGQKRLFHWCLRNDLLEQAQNQIDILIESEIKASDLEYLDRQLNVAILQKQNRDSRIAKSHLPHNDSVAVHTQPASTDLPSKPFVLKPIQVEPSLGQANLDRQTIDTSVFRPLPSIHGDVLPEERLAENSNQWRPKQIQSNQPQSPNGWDGQPTIRQVGFTEPIDADTARPDRQLIPGGRPNDMSQPQVQDDRVMTPVHELEREMRSMPRGTVGKYRQFVERTLIVGCSASNCHASDSRVMPLLHRGISKTIPLRQSQRNLHNVLKYIDREDPFASPLWIAATQPHAGNEEPMVKDQTAAYQQLTEWLVSISEDPGAAMESYQRSITPLTENENPSDAIEPIKPARAMEHPFDQSATPLPKGQTLPETGAEPPIESPVALPSTIGEIPELDSKTSGFTPVDPFDPEIFNRKFGDK